MSRSAQGPGAARVASPGTDPLQGTPYRIVGPLGAGGMGEVVEAEHVELQRRVVVKLLHKQFATDPKLVDRMRVEARTLAVLAHPNVVAVTDFGWTPGGRAYFVMERLYGRTLRAELAARGPLPVVEAIGYVRQVLAGLSAAHRLGIVHRDVKADNVFLCERTGDAQAVIKVLDFGLAKILRGTGPSRGPTPQYPTQEGVILGTPRCVAPEQALCQPVDARTDVYGVGILLYTLVVGSGPFPDARDQAALLVAHVKEAPASPSQRAKQFIPPELEQAILKSLAKRPADRFQTADEFSEELDRILTAILDTTQPFVSTRAPTSQAQSPAPVPSPADDAEGPTIVQSPPSARADEAATVPQSPPPLWEPAGPVPDFIRQRANVVPKRGISRAWLFTVALVASTTVFSGVIALVMHFWRARR